MHGEVGAAKTVVLQNIVALHIAPAVAGGHALPAVLVDTEGRFDTAAFASLLEGVISHASRSQSDCSEGQRAGGTVASNLVKEALSRLLIFRPREPIDLLRQLYQLRDLFQANPTASLLAVDSMSAWQPLTAAFPQAVTPAMRESWNALLRLQHEHCLAIVVTQRDGDGGSALPRVNGLPGMMNSCLHLNISKHSCEAQGVDGELVYARRCEMQDPTDCPSGVIFSISSHWSTATAGRSRPCGTPSFLLSDLGRVSSLAVQ